MKRGRDAPDADLEQRLVNLIVRVGDKSTGSQLSSHLEGLASALEGDLFHHRTLIVETIIDCAQSLHTKSVVYGTLVGLINASEEKVGREVVERTQRELQRALDDHAPNAIRGLSRFMVVLMNARVVTPASALELLELYMSAAGEEGPTARADWFCVLVMDALTLCGKTLSAELPAELDALVGKLRAYAAKRAPLSATAPLLLPFGASTATDELLEHFDALYLVMTTMADDGGWSSPLLLQPHRAFATELAKGTAHTAAPPTIPAHTTGCTYPFSHRLRLGDVPTSTDVAMADAPAEGEVAGDAGGGSGGGALLAPADRVIVEELIFMLIGAFSASHKDCAKLLVTMAEDLRLEVAPALAEALLALLLALPAPKHQQMYYATVLVDLCKLLPSFPPALARAINALYERLPRLDVHLAERLAITIAFHTSHFSFSLAPFEGSWGAALPPQDVKAEDGAAGPAAVALDARVRFVRVTLDYMVRLAYLERVARELPSVFKPMLPPPHAGALAWAAVREGDTEPGSPAILSAHLLGKLRTKLPPAEVMAYVDAELGSHPMRMDLVVHTLLHAGAKSVSHLEKLLEKYSWLLSHAATDSRGQQALVASACAYWRPSPQMRSILTLKLLHGRLVEPSAVLAHVFSAEGRPTLVDGTGWQIMYDAVHFAVEKQRDAAQSLRTATRRHADASADGMDDTTVGRAEDRMNAAAQANEDARRDKKAVFANFFATACAVLAEDADAPAAAAAGVAPATPEWRRLCVGHVHAVGRLHRNEFSLDTVELVAEGSDVPEAVRTEVFAPLRQLAQCCG